MKHKEHHGGAWKVAYADFVTAMMALFLVLWLTSQDKKIRQAVERAFRNPFSAVNKESTGIIPQKDTTAQAKAQGNFQSVNSVEMEMLRHITEDLAKMLQNPEEQQSVDLQLTPDGLRINVFDRSHKPIFEPGTAEFTPYGSWVFSTLAWEIARYRTFQIELEGHTAKEIPGSELRGSGSQFHAAGPTRNSKPETRNSTLSDWDLSTERANAARRKLVQNGVRPAQIFKVSGFADTQPMPNTAPTAEINRRVTVLLKLKPVGFDPGSAQASNATP